MKILLTLGEINDNYNWEKFCDMRGWSHWCINTGTAASEAKVELTIKEAKEIGINIFK